MNKERNAIEFLKDISEIELSSLPKGFNGEVIVKGNVSIYENFHLPCSLSVIGEINCKELTVDGNLKVEGYMDFEEIHVTKNFSFKGNGYSDLDIFGGNIIVDGNCDFEGDIMFDSLTVAGTLEFKETKMVGDKRVIWQQIKGTAIQISRSITF